MKLHIFKEDKARLPRQKLVRLLEAITNTEADIRSPGRINLVFTSDRRMRGLNERFCNIGRTTDVLAFGFGQSADDDDTFGEVYISIPRAKQQARHYGTSLTKELLLLACHGMLHLFGYDHASAVDAHKMKAREDHYLTLLEGR